MSGDATLNVTVTAIRPPGPALPPMFSRYKEQVEQALFRAVPAPPDSQLYLVMRYHLGWADRHGQPAKEPVSQGKALRPTLCLFACQALGGEPEQAGPAAAALEIIHNFSLLHDDIQDRDIERRHQATAWTVWGEPKALVAGNAMQSVGDLALLSSADGQVSAQTALRLSAILTESYLEMIEGQCLDLDFESRTGITTEEYLHMIACKTGALIRCSLEVGATLGADNPAATQVFARFGQCLGRVFQIRDDYLGIWGDPVATGKAVGNDIRRRKKSFPVVYGLEHATGAARDELLRIYRQEALTEADVGQVLALLEGAGASQMSQRLIQDNADQAIRELDGVSLPGWARLEAEQLVDFLARREF
ncbi:MAG: polyprenyl synthetase family protein [Dehalococcoidia bacterium]|nr:polyprenyl synthetase family protein [Dehalococcoidia bacterium]MSQ17585.1 polyprenyl synthetase family protein [Dehalococcoidia bacterium]